MTHGRTGRELDIISSGREEKRDRRPGKKKNKNDNKEILHVACVFTGLFLFLIGYLVFFNLYKSEKIISSPYNVRLNSMADRVIRGKILDRDGNVLAETKTDAEGNETRVYPYDDLFAHVVGYDSHGKAGLESTENFHLLTSNAPFAEKFIKEFQENKNTGDNVVTTLDTDLQKAAYDALGKYKGAAVVLDVTTGKILSMLSKPAFNPNKDLDDWQNISSSGESILLNRATQGAYAPGSTFKLATTLAYIRQYQDFQDYSYTCEGSINKEGTIIHCAGNKAHGTQDIAESLANSCNASYANIGLLLDMKIYGKTASDLLFNSKLPGPLPYKQSSFKLGSESSPDEIMMTAIGQGLTQVSPYHMALIASAIANGGILMEPYLVQEVVSYTGKQVEKNMPRKYAKLMTSTEAAWLKTYMQAVVEYGTAKSLKNDVYTVAGKTGTAEYSSDKDKSHSWFMGFTNVDNPELAICVIVENADNSGMSAVTVAKKILQEYYK